MTAPEWRDCADPDELAAAVAAGVEVQVQAPGGRWVACWPRNARSFAGTLHRGLLRFRIPADWSPEPPADDEPCATNPCEACRGRAVRATDECTLSPDRVGSPAGNDHPVTIPPADDLRERRVWNCKIGGRVGVLPGGADAPMRRAVAGAFAAVTGCPVEFCFSGWGDDLDESELAVVEDRAPDPEVIRAALAKRLEALPNPEPPALAVLPTPPPIPPNPMVVREFAAKVADYVSTHQNADGMSKRGWAIEAVVQALEEPTASQEARSILAPVPPWPGAVLSGLCDEDGVPTWLAQAGDVCGERVRTCVGSRWTMDGWYHRTWVEVRAPRAVPEPETERVPWWDALGRTDPNDGPIVAVEHLADRSPRVYFDPQSWMDATHPDGTVEVIKGGDR